MKNKQILLGLLLILFMCTMSSKSTFTVPETATMLFIMLVTLIFLLSYLVFRMRTGMAKIQRTIDELASELAHLKASKEAAGEPLRPEQQVSQTDEKKQLWHELDQTKRDEHVAQICQSPFNIDPPKISH